MEDRRSPMRHPLLIRAAVGSVLLGLVGLAGGCGGAGPGSVPAPEQKAKYEEGLKAQFQKQALQKKGASGRRPGRSP